MFEVQTSNISFELNHCLNKKKKKEERARGTKKNVLGKEDISLVRFRYGKKPVVGEGNLQPPRGLYISTWKFCSALNEVPRYASLALVARTIAPNGPLYNQPLV